MGTNGIYGLMRWGIRLALGFYFRRIERFHAQRVPVLGPLLFVSNHPNSLTDSFVIGTAVPRRVNFVATVQLFRLAPLKWLLTRCGVIPINRVRDDPKAMRTVADTFEACFRVMEQGQAVGIFPEGITYDDSRLKEVKSGAARMALELEHRHNGGLGLQILPVGLTYSAKERYRSDVLANFGEPIRVAAFLEGYTERRKECLHRLTAEIEHQIQALILHLPRLDHEKIVAGIKRLYLDQLRLDNQLLHEPASPRAEELVLTQAIAAAVEQAYRTQPQRAAAFAAKLERYERVLNELRLLDSSLTAKLRPKILAWRGVVGAGLAVLGAPIALYGWLHRLAPYAVVRWAVGRFTEPGKRKAQTSTAVLAAGAVAFVLAYSMYVAVFHAWFGWPASFWYALSLPPSGLIAFYYLRELQGWAASLRNAALLLRAPVTTRWLLVRRTELIAEIEAWRAETKRQSPLSPG